MTNPSPYSALLSVKEKGASLARRAPIAAFFVALFMLAGPLFLVAAPLAPASPAASGGIALPVTFEDGDAAFYELTDFGGAASSIVADPTDGSNTVVSTVRPAGEPANCFAGTTVAETSGFMPAIPFAPGATTMSVRVWSPEAGVRVLFKVEQVGVPEINVETLGMTTVAGAWETIVFDFANPMPNMNPIDFNATYNKASIFFDFSCDLPTDGNPAAQTYFWDDVTFGGETGGGDSDIALPITFEEAIDYELTDFGGNGSSIVEDPTDASNMVVQSVRAGPDAGGTCFAGTTVARTSGFADPIPFTADETTMSVRVWSPAADTRVLFKVENKDDPAVFVETLASTTMAGMWETLVFDFANPMPNGQPINFDAEYNIASVFFDFTCDLPDAPVAAEATYYWDDVAFGSDTGTPTTPIADARAAGTGNEVTIMGTVTRAMGAFTYVQDATAGITIRQTSGEFFDAVANGTIAPGSQVTITGTTSEFRGLFQINGGDLTSYSVDGTTGVPAPQMVSIADLNTNGEAYEAELVQIMDLTTDATGVFDSSTNYDINDGTADGTMRVPGSNDSAIDGTDIPAGAFTFTGVVGQFTFADPANDGYQLLAIAAGDIEAQASPVVSLPVDFEEAIDYELTDFGGAATSIIADPTDASNMVAQTVRAGPDAGGTCFAGTTIARTNGFTEPIPFTADETTMSVRVWSPAAGIPVLFKVENKDDPAVFVETLASTTMAGMWETLVFDFANPMPNGQPINFDAEYNIASVFFDFTCNLPDAPVAAEATYYWDDVAFGEGDTGGGDTVPVPAPFAGDTSDSDDTFGPRPFTVGDGTSGSCLQSGTGTDVTYDAIGFQVDMAGSYSVAANFLSGQDGYLHIYRDELIEDDPCVNLIALDDDGTGVENALIEAVDLVPGQDYVLIVSGFGNDDIGQYDGTFDGPAGASIIFGDGGGDGGPAEAIDISATPLSSLEVDTSGGFVRFVMEIENTGDEAYEVDVWGMSADALLENGVFTRNPRTPTIPAGMTYRARYNQRIPGEIADGVYSYSILVGEYNDDDPMNSEIYGRYDVMITKGVPTFQAEEHTYAGLKAQYLLNRDAEWFADALEAVRETLPPMDEKDWETVTVSDESLIENAPEVAVIAGETYSEAVGTRVGPNPFRSEARFAFDVAVESPVTLRVYDVLGREVATPVDGVLSAGRHTATLSGSGLTAGTYVYRLEIGREVETGRITLAR